MSSPKTPSDFLDAAAVKVMLRVHGGSLDGQRLEIQGGDSVIGSGPHATICLKGVGVREEHCRVACHASGATLEAAEPGIHINGVRAVKWTLHTGDWIAVGPIQLEVLSCPDPALVTGCSHESAPACNPGYPSEIDRAPDSTARFEPVLEAETAMSVPPKPAEPPPTPPVGALSAEEHDDAHEIQRYMQALLERVGASSARTSGMPASPAAPSPPMIQPAAATSASVLANRPVIGGVSSAVAPPLGSPAAQPPAMDRLRVRTPQNPIDLSEMRALANNTARAAIHRHTRKTIFSEAKKSAAVAILATMCGAGLAAAAHFEFIADEFLYVGAGLGVIGLLLGFWCAVKAASGALRRSPATRQRPKD